MQLHYQNSAENYFGNTLNRLEGEPHAARAELQTPFMDLKIMEYWVRFMRAYPDGCCRTFCECYLPARYYGAFADRVYEIRDQVDFSGTIKASIDDKFYGVRELLEAYHESRDVRFARQFFDIMAYLGRAHDCLRPVIVQIIEECTKEKIAKGCSPDDETLRRVFEIKRLFHLSDEAVELVLYLWLRNHQRLYFRLENILVKDGENFDPNERGAFSRIALLTGLEPVVIQELCSKESPLIKFQLVQMEESFRNTDLRIKRKELYLADDVSNYLYGFSDMSRIMDFKPAAKPCVPYAQIVKTNPQASFVLQMLRSHQKGSPLNILFYGREGTGKTELAKAIAQELNVTLLSVGLGEESMNEESLLQTRLRSMLLADWECERSGGVILMDEADLVLNKAEKGLLNIIFENLKTPVIWITNNIAMIENSTRRRFDYSLEFFSFSKSERIAIWQSVLKTQQAESMMRSEDIECVAKEIPVMAGSATLAVRLAQRMQSQEMPPLNVVREVASSHAKLLGISTLPQESRLQYDLDCVRISSGDVQNIDYVVPMLKNFDAHWKDSKATGRRENLNIFLYGPPGTGKSAFAKHIAHDVLCREFIVKRASDILGCHVGESEHNVSAMFREAERSDAILFIDEADSFFENRGNAKNHWEVTLVNEFICQMDSFNGMLIAATNYENVLDWAIRRRFQLKLAFDYMDLPQISRTWTAFFGSHCPKEILRCDNVAISDFQNVRCKLEYVPDELRTKELILQNMLEELANKDDHQGRRLGL
ncbi:MAG: ATP-binding protein [Fibrobacter sp.]|nr:ATP-binding protein [Fibrobacter sp.]